RKVEGGGAPSGAPVVFRLAASSFEGCGRLSALHGGDFCSPGPRFLVSAPIRRPWRRPLVGGWRFGGPTIIGAVPVQQAPCGAALVPPDRVPGPPGSGGGRPSPPAGAASHPASMTSHDNALEWMG